jgi:cytochrome b561-like protein
VNVPDEPLDLVYRHNRVTRTTHWLNALALLILLMSGLQIFNAHPLLYWGNTSEPEKAFFSIGAANDDGELRGYMQLYGRQIDTTGYLGVQQGDFAPSARAFPRAGSRFPATIRLPARAAGTFSSAGCSH